MVVLFAQGLVEYGGLATVTQAVERALFVAEDWVTTIDSRILFAGALIIGGWLCLRLFSRH